MTKLIFLFILYAQVGIALASQCDVPAAEAIGHLQQGAVMMSRKPFEVISDGSEISAATNWKALEPGIYSYVVTKNKKAYMVARAPKGVSSKDVRMLGTHRSVITKFLNSDPMQVTAAGEIHLERLTDGRIVCTEFNNKSGTFRGTEPVSAESLTDAFHLIVDRFHMPLWKDKENVKRDLTTYLKKLSDGAAKAHTDEQRNVEQMLAIEANPQAAALQKDWIKMYSRIREKFPNTERPSFASSTQFSAKIMSDIRNLDKTKPDYRAKLAAHSMALMFVKYSDPNDFFDPTSMLYSRLFDENGKLRSADVAVNKNILSDIEKYLGHLF